MYCDRSAYYQKAIKATARQLLIYSNLLWLFLLFGRLNLFDNLNIHILSTFKKAYWTRFRFAGNGRNYMQLPTAGCFPVEPHRRCCGLHGLLSARKRQLTYSFCYKPLLFIHIFFKFFFITSIRIKYQIHTISNFFDWILMVMY